MRHNEAIQVARTEVLLSECEKAEVAYRQRLEAILPELPTDLIVARAKGLDYRVPQSAEDTDYNEAMEQADDQLTTTWGGDAERRINGPVDLYVLAKLNTFHSRQMKASRRLGNRSGQGEQLVHGIKHTASEYAREFRHKIEPATQELIKDELLRRVANAAEQAHYGHAEREGRFLSKLEKYQGISTEHAWQSVASILDMYQDVATEKNRNYAKEKFLAQAFAAFAKLDSRGYGSELIPLQTRKRDEVVRLMTDEANALITGIRIASPTKVEKILEERVISKFAPLFTALEVSVPQISIIEQPPKTAEVAQRVRIVGKQSVDAAKVAGKVTRKAAIPGLAAGGIAIQTIASPAVAHAAGAPRIKTESVASQIVDMAPVAFVEKTQPKTKEQLKNETFRAEINKRVGQSEKLGGMWAKWDTVDPDKLYHAIIKYENKYKNQSPIDRYDALAQAWQESRLKGNAVSGAGAIGLTQFMPATWKGWMGDKSPYDTDASIEALFKYDSYIYKKMDNKFPGYKVDTKKKLTFGGYNAGPGSVSDGRLPNYSETKTYVHNIMADAANLRAAALKAAEKGTAVAPKPAPKPTPKPDSKPAPTPPVEGNVTPDEGKFVPIDLKIFAGLGSGDTAVQAGTQENGSANIELVPSTPQAAEGESTNPNNAPSPNIDIVGLIGSMATAPDTIKQHDTTTTPGITDTVPNLGGSSVDVVGNQGSDSLTPAPIIIEQAPYITPTTPDGSATPSSPSVGMNPEATPPAGAAPSAPANTETPSSAESQPSPHADLGSLIGMTAVAPPATERQPASSESAGSTPPADISTPQDTSSSAPSSTQTSPSGSQSEQITISTPNETSQPAATETASEPATTTIDLQSTKEGEVVIAQPDQQPAPGSNDKPADSSAAAPAAEKPKDNKEQKPAADPAPKQNPAPTPKRAGEMSRGDYAKELGISSSDLLNSRTGEGIYLSKDAYNKLGFEKIRKQYRKEYPDDWKADENGMYTGQCVSWSGFRVDNDKFKKKMPNWGGRGNAHQWIQNAKNAGIDVNRTPAVGSVMEWDRGAAHHEPYGHSAYVERVLSDGSALITEYNNEGTRLPTARIITADEIKQNNKVWFLHFEK